MLISLLYQNGFKLQLRHIYKYRSILSCLIPVNNAIILRITFYVIHVYWSQNIFPNTLLQFSILLFSILKCVIIQVSYFGFVKKILLIEKFHSQNYNNLLLKMLLYSFHRPTPQNSPLIQRLSQYLAYSKHLLNACCRRYYFKQSQ